MIAFAFIPSLFRPRGPTAVIWRVIAIVVYAIKRKAGLALAHICEKIFKLSPAFANFNPSAAIVFIRNVFLVFASGLHTEPRIICRGIFRIPVFFIVSFLFEASTRSRVSALQVSVRDVQLCAANALAKPINFSFTSMRKLNRSQTLKALTRDINVIGHRTVPVGSRSSGGQTRQGLAVALMEG